MSIRKLMLSLVAVTTLLALPMAASPKAAKANKAAAANHSKDQSFQGTLVSVSGDTLVARSGHKDRVFALTPSTVKPASLTPGTAVAVNFHDEGRKHIASSISLSTKK